MSRQIIQIISKLFQNYFHIGLGCGLRSGPCCTCPTDGVDGGTECQTVEIENILSWKGVWDDLNCIKLYQPPTQETMMSKV